MTDKLSERAEQLGWRVVDWYYTHMTSYNGQELRDKIAEESLKFAADSANLARGVALEQAAQVVRKELEANANVIGYHGRRVVLEIQKSIRSLDPDAAQALAAHDEELNTLIDNQRVALGEARIDINNLLALLMAHQENTKEYLESDDAAVLNDIEERWRTPSGRNWLKDHDAEIERRTRLDEHLKICKQCGIGMRCERGNWLFQPAPAKEDK